MDLTSNLISELIGITITVFVVDRLINWRNKKKWKEVKKTFIILAAHHTDKILEKWSSWLCSSGKIDESVISKYFEADNKYKFHGLFRKPSPKLLKMYQEQACREKLECIQKMHKLLATMPIDPENSSATLLFGNVEDYDEVIRQIEDCPDFFQLLFDRHGIVEYEAGQHKIHELRAELEPWVEKLNNLIDRYTLVIDERISLPIIKLSLAIHELDYSTAMSIQDGFINSLKLDGYFRRECQKLHGLEELEDDGLGYTRLEKLGKLIRRLKAKLSA